jgi:uncharacterized protein YicC (UPF0701 family)
MMNNLTNDITRLCGEIAALRDTRANLMSNLAEARTDMQAAVTRMLAGFGEARSEMAKQTKADLSGFVGRVKEAVTELRQKVAKLQDEFRDDVAGAHRAWHGAGPAPRTFAPRAAEPPFQAKEPADELAPKGKKRKR